MVRTVYQQPSPEEVHAQVDRVIDQLGDRFSQAASVLAEAGADILAFTAFPVAHWKQVWSNNPQERRLVGAVLAEQHDEWAVGRRYLTPALPALDEVLPEATLTQPTAA